MTIVCAHSDVSSDYKGQCFWDSVHLSGSARLFAGKSWVSGRAPRLTTEWSGECGREGAHPSAHRGREPTPQPTASPSPPPGLPRLPWPGPFSGGQSLSPPPRGRCHISSGSKAILGKWGTKWGSAVGLTGLGKRTFSCVEPHRISHPPNKD